MALTQPCVFKINSFVNIYKRDKVGQWLVECHRWGKVLPGITFNLLPFKKGLYAQKCTLTKCKQLYSKTDFWHFCVFFFVYFNAVLEELKKSEQIASLGWFKMNTEFKRIIRLPLLEGEGILQQSFFFDTAMLASYIYLSSLTSTKSFFPNKFHSPDFCCWGKKAYLIF